MDSGDVVAAFWAAMEANDWEAAAGLMAATCVVDWPCSGERITGPEALAELQASYPSRTGEWSFEIHRIVESPDTVVSEVTVSDGEQAARVVAFSDVADGAIVRQVEYWPTAYDPPPGRERLTSAIERIP